MLANDYRPSKFSEITGQNAARLILQAFVVKGECPPAFLFIGPSGTGKTTTARVFAAALNCLNEVNADACSECDSCLSIRQGTSDAVVEIDAASNGGVDNIRALKDLSQYSSSSSWRVIILDEAHAMSNQAFNALLKVLEEPMSNTVFVLLTTEPNKILKTVASRAMPIRFTTVTPPMIVDRLKVICEAESFVKANDDVLKEISIISEGNLRNAVVLLEQAHMVDMLTVEGVRSLTNRSNLPYALGESLLKQPLLDNRKLLEAYFKVNSDPVPLVTGLIKSVQSHFSNNAINNIQLMTSMKLLWDARTVQSLSKDSQAQIEAMVTLLHGVLQPVKPKPQKTILQVEETKPSPPTDDDETISSLEELVNLV